jgi:nucleoid-associated protein YgaU
MAATGAASDVEVTRAITPAEPVVAPAAQAIQPQPQAPQPRRPETSDVSMDDMTASVLADLGFETEAPEAPNVEEQQIETTAGILASIESVTGQQVELAPRQTLQTLVVTALREGQSDDYIDALVNEAAATGRVTVPEVMVTSDGRVDTAVLLDNLVTHAIIASGGNVPVPDVDPTTNPGVEVRVVQRAQDAVQARFYTVQTGDSLGAIAVKFYGRVDLFDRIFEANRQTLSSPDLIRTGQRLVIPALDA